MRTPGLPQHIALEYNEKLTAVRTQVKAVLDSTLISKYPQLLIDNVWNKIK